jgi:hypothetical protein
LQSKRNRNCFQTLKKIQKDSACGQWKGRKKQGRNSRKSRLPVWGERLPGSSELMDAKKSGCNFTTDNSEDSNCDRWCKSGMNIGCIEEDNKKDPDQLFK